MEPFARDMGYAGPPFAWDPARRFGSELAAAVGLLLFSKYKGALLPKTLLLIGLRDGFFCYRYARPQFARELAASLASLAAQLGFFVALFGPALGALCFFAHSCVGLVYLNVVFTGSHYDLEVFDEATAATLDFAELQLRTTRNYPPGAVAAFFFGGVEYQIEHHLFPSMPRRGFARASREVRAFCDARGLEYKVMPFVDAVRAALRYHVAAR
jgi:fatty acid desaturase